MTAAALSGAVPAAGAATPASAPAQAHARTGQRPSYARPFPPADPPVGPDFGPNVRVFGPDTPVGQVQDALDAAAIGGGRYAFLFRPGRYGVEVPLGPRTSVAGLGAHPGDVTLDGTVRSADQAGPGAGSGSDAWRSADNLTIAPPGGTLRWAVSPAAPLRRVHVRGRLLLAPGTDGPSDGGFVADTVVDGEVLGTARQRAFVRDCRVGGRPDPSGHQMFVGVEEAPGRPVPAPGPSRAAAHATPPAGRPGREKPFLYVDEAGRYRVFLPGLRHDAVGASWSGGSAPGSSVPIDRFFVARPTDSVRTLNKALSQGRHLLLTPGVYEPADTIKVKWAGTVVLGLGHVTLAPRQGVVPMTVADARGVRIAGLVFDGGRAGAPVLLEIGARPGGRSDPREPASVQGVYFRIGGAGPAHGALVVNSDHVLLDDVRVWDVREWHAGHRTGEDRTADGATGAGVVVHGDDVLATGLFAAGFGISGRPVWREAAEGGRAPTGGP